MPEAEAAPIIPITSAEREAELVKRYFMANATIGETNRFRQLDRYDAHYHMEQYAYLPYDWWGMSADQMETVSPALQVPNGFTQPALSLLSRQKRPTAPFHLCVAGNQRLTLGDGSIIPIESFAGGEVYAASPSYKLVKAVADGAVRTKREFIREIVLRNGRTLRVTHDHKIMVATRDEFCWKRAEEIAPGDYVAAARYVHTAGRADELTLEDAALAGYLAGDGAVVSGVTFCNQNPELIDRVRELAAACDLRFGWDNGKRWGIRGPWQHENRNAEKRRSSGAAWAERVGLYGCRAWDKRAPKELFRASEDRIAAFIGGLWDTDGFVSKDNAYSCLTTTSRGLAEDAQDLLLRLGVLSYVFPAGIVPETGRPKYQVGISGKSLVTFARKVTLYRRKKAERLLLHVIAQERRGLKSADYIDVVPPAWRNLAAHGHEVKRGRALSRNTLLGFGQDEANESLIALANSDVQWVKVESCSDAPEEDVFDISVPGPECFVAENAVVHNCRAIVDRLTGLLFSESRKPNIEVEGDPDTDDFMHACMEQMRFWSRWREARALGGSSGSVLVTVHLKRGKFVMQSHPSKHVQMLWADRRALEPKGALIMYSYPKEEMERDPRTGEMHPRIVNYLYRRIITEMDDTVYRETKVQTNQALTWEVEATAQHGLGRFPGVWIQNLPDSESEDGVPDCAGAWQTFDTIDRLIAQANKSVLLNMDPTLKMKIDPKEKLQGAGQVTQTGSDVTLNVGANGDAAYVEISGGGIEQGHKLIDRLVRNALTVTRCVMLDPEKLSGAAQSAKAMEYIFASMLEKADDLRSQYGEGGVVPVLKIVEDLARLHHDQEVELPGGTKGVEKIDLPPKPKGGGERKLGPGGWIRLDWGPYFAPTEQDNQIAVNTVVAAVTGEVLDAETGARRVGQIYSVKDPDEMLKKIAKAKQDQMATMLGNSYGELTGTPVSEAQPPENGPPAGEGGKP